MFTEILTWYNCVRNGNGFTKPHSLYVIFFEEHIIMRMQELLYILCEHISDSILHAHAKPNQ